MIKEILPNLFKIEIPLPNNPLKSLNSYIIKSKGKNLIIDTGMNREECKKVMEQSLKKLDIELEETDLFITHLHADHCGLVNYLSTKNTTIFCSEADGNIINSLNDTKKWQGMSHFISFSSFPPEELKAALTNHPGYKYSPRKYIEFSIVKEGSILEIGNYTFYCLETPGHTFGHICLYEPGEKLLISGDHLLIDITPNISAWSDRVNPLEQYLKSLDKIYKLDISIVLPGHRRIFYNYQERISELKLHHQERANEIINILKYQGPQDGYQVAAQMTWDIKYDSWNQFPPQQKWFAVGEAIAHLNYLEGRNLIHKELKDNKLVYQLSSK